WGDIWNRPDLLSDYPVLSSQYIAEIFCRLARVETDYARTEVPSEPPPFAVPGVLLSTGGGRSAKLWPAANWQALTAWLRAQGIEAGLLGAAPSIQRQRYHTADTDDAVIDAGARDLRGRLSLPQVSGALARARALVTIDSGLVHLAGAVGAPTLALFGASPRRIWAPRSSAVRIIEPSRPCTLCEEHRFKNDACLLPVHQCMESIEPSR